MKRIIILCLICTLLLACVPTPEEEYVVNKGDKPPTVRQGEMDDQIQGILNAVPAEWNDTFSFRDGTVSVTVSAKISVPEVLRFPIVEVKPAAIDPQIAAKLLYKLIPGGSLRISDHGGQAYSVEDVDQWIEEVKQMLSHTSEMSFDSDADRDAYIDTQNAELERLFEMRQSAVSGTVTSLDAYELIGRYGAMECHVLDANGLECANFMWKPQSGDTQDKRESVLHIGSITPACGLLDHGVQSAEEAKLTADTLIEGIGLSDRYACVSVMDGHNTVRCYYAPAYNGIASSPFTETAIDANAYGAPWPNEMLLVCFYKWDGRTTVSYVCPSEIVSELGNAALLPFSDIQAQFEKSMKATYSWLDESTISAEIAVNRISLGYFRIPMKDHPNRYTLIPVWTFEGSRTTREKADGGAEPFDNANDLPNNVLMILSGIDGSLLYAG